MCGGVGTCVDFGCMCDGAGEGAGGDFCTADQVDSESAGTRTVPLDMTLVAAVTAVTTAVSAVLVLGNPLSSSSLLLSLSGQTRGRYYSRRVHDVF